MAKQTMFNKLRERYAAGTAEEMPLEEYLARLKKDPSIAAGPAERLLKAIGEPKLIDTANNGRLRRLYSSRVIKRYPTFADFYGLEDTVEEIVGFIKHAAQGLEEARQVLYLLGPPGSAKSSLSIRLRELMQKEPIYVLKGSPVNESPLGLFSVEDAEELEINKRYLKYVPSPWAVKRLTEFEGDASKFVVQKIYPNENKQQGVAVAAAGDPNTQDVSTLVGKVDLRKLEYHSQSDSDAYNYSGALCKANQGILEFVEMFKADIKMLNPLLTATQEGNYVGTENIGLIPFEGLILAHSNESEWDKFVHDSTNEAFLDRINLVKVPYVLSIDEEVQIYRKIIANSELRDAPCAPGTLEALAKFVVASRLELDKISMLEPKLLAYNGENIREKYPNSDTYAEFKAKASHREGFEGISTRDAFKILSKLYNFDEKEVGANPIQLLEVLRKHIVSSTSNFNGEDLALVESILSYIDDELYKEVGKVFQEAFLGSGLQEVGQNKFEQYVTKCIHWLNDNDYRDAETGTILDREGLNSELEAIEKPADIRNHKEFRDQVVRFALQYQANHDGRYPDWRSYTKFRNVLEQSIFNQMEDLLPVLSMSGQGSEDQRGQHKNFIDGMRELGYTPRQVQIMQKWFVRKQASK